MSTVTDTQIDKLQQVWLEDPLRFKAMLWPDVAFYDRQIEVVESVCHNKETVVIAGNMLGKDFIAGFICLWFFLVHDFVRVLTTSVKDDHLDILWSEINKFIRTSALPLKVEDGGLLKVVHHEIRKVCGSDTAIEHSYIKGQVSKKGEGLSGHHAAHTLLVVDEASGVDQQVYDHGMEWAGKALIFGNPNPCNNFFSKADEEGDLKLAGRKHFTRKLLRICAEDSPNVKYGLKEKELGFEPSHRRVLDGVLSYDEYELRRATWDQIMQCIKLDAQFYKGAEVLMFPPDWLNAAEAKAKELPPVRLGKAMGVDTAEGGDSTVWAIIDEQGLIELISMKTPDTSIIKGRTLALMNEFGLDPDKVIFDQGGGGQEHADYLRAGGVNVRTVSFGEAVAPAPTRFLRPWEEVQHDRREKYTFKNRRAQMYWLLRQRLQPTPLLEDLEHEGLNQYVDKDRMAKPAFGIPSKFTELRRQLAPIPLTYDDEGKIYLLPKRNKPNTGLRSMLQVQSLTELIGCSPDEADALVMAIYAMDDSTAPIVLRPMF